MADFSKFAGARRWVKLDKTQILPTDIATVLTDGACKNNPHGPGGWGWWRDEHCWAAGGFEVASNNVAELTAILQALRAAPSGEDLAIVSDSEYAVMSASVWATGWKSRGWRKADGNPVENRALVQAVHEALIARTGLTYLKRVRGHGRDATMLPAHVVGNEHADRLACEAKERSIAGDTAAFGPGWDQNPVRPVVEVAEPIETTAPASTSNGEDCRCGRCGADPTTGAALRLTIENGGLAERLTLCSQCATALNDFLWPDAREGAA